MDESVTFAECKAVEERVTYHLERECERVQKKMELELQDLGKSMVDCLKRQDAQIDHKLKNLYACYVYSQTSKVKSFCSCFQSCSWQPDLPCAKQPNVLLRRHVNDVIPSSSEVRISQF